MARALVSAWFELSRARLLLWGDLSDLPLDVGDAGEGADVDLVVGPLEALFSLPLGPSAPEDRAKVAAQEAQWN